MIHAEGHGVFTDRISLSPLWWSQLYVQMEHFCDVVRVAVLQTPEVFQVQTFYRIHSVGLQQAH